MTKAAQVAHRDRNALSNRVEYDGITKKGIEMKAVLLSGLMGITTLLPISTAIAADCYSGGGGSFEATFRKEEAVRLTTELNSKIMNALDKVLLSTDASRVNPPDITTNFGWNIKFVLDLQLDQEKMDLLIERPPAITTAQQFIDTWFGLTTFFKYRKRYITNSILVDYRDINCLREVSLYGIGQSFGILSHLPGNEPPGALPGPPWHTTLNFVDFDRFTITWKEAATGVFRVQKLVQFTESTFPLGNDPSAGVPTTPVDRSPFAPGAPGNYTPTAP